ncbi:Squalene/phytoene synthase-domain-containing protein [Halteromyces radiatus]|uniref:Squalene/phytoene synthase-domain-containing protein n=1 Tax=Halteromyces radiatus TaxID=101107 RepID=UPI00222058C8|nr:Squalene/phytoene synthase-domain-containing protein [Halteromyces radiatus]KAI8096376.1 Squalene/phytoene synthase-domain-containing protein [Halteromyces radiatus]
MNPSSTLQQQQQQQPSSCSIFSIFCFILGLLWQYSGAYFVRRRYALLSSALVPTILGSMYQLASPSSSFIYHWQIMDWFFMMLTVVTSSCFLDNADAILNTYPQLAVPNNDPVKMSSLQSPTTFVYWKSMFHIINDILSNQHELCPDPVMDLMQVIKGLGPASRSWKTMAALFPTNLRQDLCILYGFFRACDDLVDDPPTLEQRHHNLQLIRAFLRLLLNPPQNQKMENDMMTPAQMLDINKSIDITLLQHHQIDWNSLWHRLDQNIMAFASFRSLGRIASYLCPKAADDLCVAWKMDLVGKPIKTQQELLHYAALISGKFGELCTCVIMYKTGRGNWNGKDLIARNNQVLARATATGQCLQLVNIARDILRDSLDNRCYVPLSFMPNKTTYDLLKMRKADRVGNDIVKSYAVRILDLADRVSDKAQLGIDGLPEEVQDGIRAAFEIYMAIGPIIRQDLVFPLRAKVPTWRKQWIAFRCIYGFKLSLLRSLKATWSRTVSSTKTQ